MANWKIIGTDGWFRLRITPGSGSDSVVLSEEHQRILDAIRRHEIEEWQKSQARRQANRPPEPEAS